MAMTSVTMKTKRMKLLTHPQAHGCRSIDYKMVLRDQSDLSS